MNESDRHGFAVPLDHVAIIVPIEIWMVQDTKVTQLRARGYCVLEFSCVSSVYRTLFFLSHQDVPNADGSKLQVARGSTLELVGIKEVGTHVRPIASIHTNT